MICYKDTTWCSGGSPRCAVFGGCPRALTDAVKAQAQATGLPIMEFVAPKSLPCYQAVVPIATAAKGRPTKTGRKIRFRQSKFTDAQWRKQITQMPRRSDVEIAQALRCSNTTVRTARIRMGYPPALPPGINRKTIFTESDAIRLIEAVRPEDKHLLQASRRLGLTDNTAKHLRDRFREIFKQHGL